MTIEISLPDLGESVTEAVITRWLKNVGDTVEENEPLVEVSTDKVDTEIPSPVDGLIEVLLVETNDTVAVGSPIAKLGVPPESSPVDPAPGPVADAPSPAIEPDVAKSSPPQNFSPVSGQDSTQPSRTRTEKLSRIRQTIARRMVSSLQTSAQLTSVVEVDVTQLVRFRNQAKDDFRARHGVSLSLLPFLAHAAINALHDHPVHNASLGEDDTATFHGPCHLGIAVDAPRGLMVPVIRDAHLKSVTELALAIADVAARTRNNKITPDELSGGTFTITNTGSRGALFDTPIINQPQSAILGTGAVVERLVPLPDGAGSHNISVRSMMYLSETYDHRLVDGADSARFLTAIKKSLEGHQFTL